MQVTLSTFHWIILGSALLFAAGYDIAKRRVPNWLTVFVLCYGLIARFSADGWIALAWGVAGAVLALALLIIPFAKGLIGGGDVKLLIASGAWLGPSALAEAALFGALAGGIVSLIYLVRAPKSVRRDVLFNLKLSLFSLRMVEVDRRPGKIDPPYAPAIAIGVALALWKQGNCLFG